MTPPINRFVPIKFVPIKFVPIKFVPIKFPTKFAQPNLRLLPAIGLVCGIGAFVFCRLFTFDFHLGNRAAFVENPFVAAHTDTAIQTLENVSDSFALSLEKILPTYIFQIVSPLQKFVSAFM